MSKLNFMKDMTKLIITIWKNSDIARESYNYRQFRQSQQEIVGNKKYILYNKYQNIVKKVGDKS